VSPEIFTGVCLTAPLFWAMTPRYWVIGFQGFEENRCFPNVENRLPSVGALCLNEWRSPLSIFQGILYIFQWLTVVVVKRISRHWLFLRIWDSSFPLMVGHQLHKQCIMCFFYPPSVIGKCSPSNGSSKLWDQHSLWLLRSQHVM
jgi:hypothetical protein